MPVFQSTLPMKGATCDGYKNDIMHIVSIHAPNEGSDDYYFIVYDISYGFNPRSQ